MGFFMAGTNCSRILVTMTSGVFLNTRKKMGLIEIWVHEYVIEILVHPGASVFPSSTLAQGLWYTNMKACLMFMRFPICSRVLGWACLLRRRPGSAPACRAAFLKCVRGGICNFLLTQGAIQTRLDTSHSWDAVMCGDRWS